MSNFIDLTGQRFGKLTVIDSAGKNRHGTRSWNVSCDCGTKKTMLTGNLLRKSNKSCGCIKPGRMPPIDFIGQKIYRLTVIDYIPSNLLNNKRNFFKVLCDCGVKKEIEAHHVTKGIVKSCGCLNDEKRKIGGGNKCTSKPKERGINSLFKSYISSAKQRSLEFKLTKEQFVSLTSSDCNYCGTPPYSVKLVGEYHNLSKEACDRAKYVYNGIDRMNNSLGYTLDNAVPCCKRCNYAKHSSSLEEWNSWIERFIAFQIAKKTKLP